MKHNLFYATGLNSDYLSTEDKYLFSRPEPIFKFNVIGSGMMGQEHIRVTMLEGRATIHGIYDPSRQSVQSAQRMFKSMYPNRELKIYSSLQEACMDPEVDALIICTPNYTHLTVVREAIKSGKHILLEKPIATSIEDALEIKRLAEAYESVFQIGLQYRFKAIYNEAIHEVLERKSIGDVKLINMIEHRIPFLDKVGQWNKFNDYSGGTLVEKCCHYFDIMNLFAQARPVQVYATGGQSVNFLSFEFNGKKSDIIDHASVLITYENGIQATFNLCMFAPMFYEEITICGDEGRLKAFECTDFLPKVRDNTYLEVLGGDHRPTKISTPCYPSVIQDSGHHGGTYFEHKYFVDNIQGKRTNAATVDDGFWSIVVGVAAQRSIESGSVIVIQELLDSLGIKQ